MKQILQQFLRQNLKHPLVTKLFQNLTLKLLLSPQILKLMPQKNLIQKLLTQKLMIPMILETLKLEEILRQEILPMTQILKLTYLKPMILNLTQNMTPFLN